MITFNRLVLNRLVAAAAIVGAISSARVAGAADQSAIDNEHVSITAVMGVQPPAQHDFVAVSLSRPGTASFGHRGEAPGAPGARTVLIELKDQPAARLANSTPYPLAFPRPHAKKLLENERVVVWQYTWYPNEPTPMHFHDKDAVSVFEGEGAIKSSPLNGESSVGAFKFGDFRYNLHGRVHTEVLAAGKPQAVIVELK